MSDLFSETHRLIPFAVIAASLAGSAHCLGMCGPLVTASSRGALGVLAYHLGRLFSYAGLGLVAGWAGDRVFAAQAGGWVWQLAQWASALALGLAFITLGLRSFRGQGGAHLWKMPPVLARALSSLLGPGGSRDSLSRSAAVGALSAFLACGWLHSFVLAAVTTRSAASGAALMALFWVGTLPALTAAPVLALKLLNPLSSKAPRLTGLLLMAAGLAAVGLKLGPALHPGGHGGAAEPACHHQPGGTGP